ncbi:NAD-dependent epimerase/dehydratase family protein [Pseudenhygromyxa sp. WMMC2535]|uniref:NAD-dependent epimerase/dehydratase family protein n=1 Tax=Pseudenhygromyxa sp. WMMC2535 TaxID=2712867 RepID=UPI001551C1B8|nr:NAD-dependent epimerase/dehydratase family protein [Pseudenhygromyxa sp. WMMC2535]NVB42268.1 NAD-dependent epimerase/dehydratase family protein [Pseudenhygromyxa sp. WMMC2535]
MRTTSVVTGASGHLGANVVRALIARGDRVRVLVHRSSAALAELDGQLEIVAGSVTDLESLRVAFAGADRVYHLAAVISMVGDPGGRMQAVNVEGTAKVATACRELGVGRMVHCSSVHAYDQHPLDEVLDEGRPQIAEDPSCTAYDRSKALSERVVREAVAAGLDAVIVNPTGVIGPVDFGPSRLGEVLINLATGRLPALLEGGFDFVDVRDVALGALAAGERGRAGEGYILAGSWHSLVELAAHVEAVCGRRAPSMVSPMWLARVGVPFAEALAKLSEREPLVTHESLDVLLSHRSISSAKAREELGYSTRSLRETVTDALAWFEARGDLAPPHGLAGMLSSLNLDLNVVSDLGARLRGR